MELVALAFALLITAFIGCIAWMEFRFNKDYPFINNKREKKKSKDNNFQN